MTTTFRSAHFRIVRQQLSEALTHRAFLLLNVVLFGSQAKFIQVQFYTVFSILNPPFVLPSRFPYQPFLHSIDLIVYRYIILPTTPQK